MSNEFRPAENLREARKQARLGPLPAGDPRYVDLSPARGEGVIKRFIRMLDTDPDEKVYIAYAGHRGSGKSTELNILRKKLETSSDYYIVYQDAYPDLAIIDLSYTDLLLYMVQTVFEQVYQEVEINDKILAPVENWFLEKVNIKREEIEKEIKLSAGVEAKASIPFLGKLFGSLVSRIKGSSSQVREIRENLQRSPEELLGHINFVLDTVTENLRKAGKAQRILLILDSLDRHPPEIIARAFVEYAHIFTRLSVNLILTVPLGLIYLPTRDSLQDTGFHQVTLPIARIRKREQSWEEYDEEAVTLLEEVVRKRVNVNKVFENEEIVRKMVLLSGGSLRELMELLYESSLEATGDKTDMEALKRGERNVRKAFTAHLRLKDLEILRNIHCNKWVDRTPEEFRLLFYRFALEYNTEQWFDVHPIIYHDEKFQKILKERPCP